MGGQIKNSKSKGKKGGKEGKLVPSEDASTKEILDCLKNNSDKYKLNVSKITTYDHAINAEKVEELETIENRFTEWYRKCDEKIEDEFEKIIEQNRYKLKLEQCRNNFCEEVDQGNAKLDSLKNQGQDSNAVYGGMGGTGSGNGGSFFERRSSVDSNGGSNVNESKFQELQLQQEDAVNEAILKEREEDINVINQQVQVVHETFKDLAILVNDQQEHIDTIAKNVEVAHDNTKEGVKQLEKAAEYQTTCTIS